MKDTQIAFFTELNNNQSAIEGADIDKGNPGIGGTQYLFLLTVKELNKSCGNQYAILLTNIYFRSADPGINTGFSESVADAVEYCERYGISCLVLNANVAGRIPVKVFHTSVAIILWAHNTLTAKGQRVAAKTRSIKWVVCVSKSQYYNMADTPCFSKCTYINNVIPSLFYEQATLTDYSEEKVAYVGCLVPQKGAHNLIEIWKYVEESLPRAQLYILGGANVWNDNAILESSVADVYYDRVLQKQLNKLIHPENIHFMGAKGWAYIDSFIKTFRLGIVNPSHYMRDETFCLSAIELAAHGLPIVSRQRYDGLSTTVLQGKTGYLEKTDKQIADRIISIVSNPDACRALGMEGQAYAKNFVAQNVIGKWRELVERPGANVLGNKPAFFSKDAVMLRKDFILKLAFLIESGKLIALFKKKLKGGN